MLACHRPLFTSLRSSDAGAPRYPWINRRPVRRRSSSSSSSKAQLGNSPARTSPTTTRRSQSVICPSRRLLVSASGPGRPRGPCKRAPTGSHHRPRRRQVNLVAEPINHLINATSYSPFIVSAPPCTKTPLCNSRLTCGMQSSSHVAEQLRPSRPLLQQLPTDGILRNGSSPHLTPSAGVVSASCHTHTHTHTHTQRERERRERERPATN